ncbi:4117_t:CDS:10 [Ambispora leptoticha]|uniref:4117_t:CDS:1 n=1 Tax=Ambispora leptoticha TaxID=144679 RepID=A0A9N8VEN9_9GLOM|nr:4117_t:CDS:10 [Ambispora leptoticha]
MPERVLSVKEIAEQANHGVKVYPNISLKMHLRTVNTLAQQANSYKQEGNFQEAYKFYMRFAIMALEKLPGEHPEYKKPKYKADISALKKNANKVLKEIENLKPALIEKYNNHKAKEEARKQKLELQEQQEDENIKQQSQPESSKDHVHTTTTAIATSTSYENWSLTEELKDLHVGESNVTVDISYPYYSSYSENNEPKLSYPGVSDHNKSDGFTYTVNHQIDSSVTPPKPPAKIPPLNDNGQSILHYEAQTQHVVSPTTYEMPVPVIPEKHPIIPEKQPIIPEKQPIIPEKYPIPAPSSPISPPSYSVIAPPALPPKVPNDIQDQLFPRPPLPPKPSEYQIDGYSSNELDLPIKGNSLDFIHEFQDYTEGGEPLRRISVPFELTKKFLDIASQNTRNNLETLGILSGTLSQNAFTVTTLIVPKQTATSDTCAAMNEEEYCEYEIENGLLELGWIHTHPSQTCFMSSMDLHTHSSYQYTLPEAIAIVCAPKYNEVGIFRLTHPPGLDTVMNCNERGFHPHPNETNICKNISDLPSHVVMKEMGLTVVDLR